MNTIEKEIEAIRHELAVTIPEELQNVRYSNDILECSEYSEILTRQNLLSLRLMQLNKRLHNTNIIKHIPVSPTHVGLGSIVVLERLPTGEQSILKIVSCEMLNPSGDSNEATIQSPIGKALYNRQVNDIIVVRIPAGTVRYRIISLTGNE